MSTRILALGVALCALGLGSCKGWPDWPCEWFPDYQTSHVTGPCGQSACSRDTIRVAKDAALPFDWVLLIEPQKHSTAERFAFVSDAPEQVSLSSLQALEAESIASPDGCTTGRKVSFHGWLEALALGSTTVRAQDGAREVRALTVEVSEIEHLSVLAGTDEEAGVALAEATLQLDDPSLFVLDAVALSAAGDVLGASDDLFTWSVEPEGVVALDAKGARASIFARSEGTALLRVQAGSAHLDVPVTVTSLPPAP